RMGLAPVADPGVPCRLRGGAGRGRGAIRRWPGAAPAGMERVPGRAARVRVLVRRRFPPARALELRARRGRHLVQADAAAMNPVRARPPRAAGLACWGAMRAALWPE